MATETETQAPATALRIQAERVLAVRRNAESLASALKAKRAAFDADNADLIALLSAGQNDLLTEELRLRDMAVAEYKVTGDAKPCPGVQIKQETAIAYEPAAAFAWAQQTGMALALDKRAFESIAKAAVLPFVTVDKVPKATIATDLGKALEGGAA